MKMDLLGFVRARIGSYQGPLSELAREAGVKASWLHMFARGEIPNPGVQQVQRLADVLNRTPDPRSDSSTPAKAA